MSGPMMATTLARACCHSADFASSPASSWSQSTSPAVGVHLEMAVGGAALGVACITDEADDRPLLDGLPARDPRREIAGMGAEEVRAVGHVEVDVLAADRLLAEADGAVGRGTDRCPSSGEDVVALV